MWTIDRRVGFPANDVDGADDVLLHLGACGVLVAGVQGGADAFVVVVSVVEVELSGWGTPEVLIRKSDRSHRSLTW
jgi:hypothetical protein